MKKNSNKIIQPLYLTFFGSEIQAVAGIAATSGNFEDGGMGFGLQTHGGRPVIYLVTGAGPNAVHQHAHFQQDIEFVHEINRVVQKLYGLQWQIDWHNHHTLGLNEPSGVDIMQMRSVTNKNNFGRWAGVITTVQGGDYPDTFHGVNSRRLAVRPPSSLRVTVHAFIYDPQSGELFKAKIRVIPEMSPVRLAALACGKPDSVALGEYASGFPMDQIVYDPFDPDEFLSDASQRIPESLVTQLRQLPSEAKQEDINLNVADDQVIIELPLPGDAIVNVSVGLDAPHQIRGVYIEDETAADPKDITSIVLAKGCDINLSRAYEILSSIIREANPTRVTRRGVKAFLDDFWHRNDAADKAAPHATSKSGHTEQLEEKSCHGA